jgi:peptidyl-tRNA hydrolase
MVNKNQPTAACEKQKPKKVFCEAAWYLQESVLFLKPTTFMACSKF